MKPIVALVQGDAAGIGPELMAKLLSLADVREAAHILIVGDRAVLEAGCRVARVEHKLNVIESAEAARFENGAFDLLELHALDVNAVTPGVVSEEAGRAVLSWYGTALDLCKRGFAHGLCFMPFNKAAMHRAGLDTEDETQWARQRVGCAGRVSEFNVVDNMWNARVTSHIPLKDVAGRLSIEEIVASVKLADETLRAAGYSTPRIAVAALNPHAGDGGNIGREEIDIIKPAVDVAQRLGIAAEGPFPSDTLYLRVRDGDFDCAVSMYHDQGQIAIKLLGFHMGVSVLSGLPFPMATPAHGTAFDIVGRNKANAEPARRALLTVARMAAG